MNPSVDIPRFQNTDPSSQTDDDELGLRDLLRKLYRQKMVILSVFILVFVLTMLHVSRQTPLYTATTQLIFNTRQNSVLDVGGVLSGLPAYYYGFEVAIKSELEILRSGPFLERVVNQLNLTRDPLFNPSLQPPPKKGLLDDAHDWIKNLLRKDAGATENESEFEDTVDPALKAEQVRKMIIGRLAGGLSPELVPDSYTLKLSYTFTDPQRAADVVNAVADAYLTDQLEAKFEATRRANEWLSERLNDLRKEVHAAELAVQQVKKQGDMMRTRGSTLIEEQIAEINAQLVIARVNRSQAEARLQWVRDNINRDSAMEIMADGSSSADIHRMRTEETQLHRRQLELSGRYGPRHPEMLKITAELNDLREKIREGTQRFVENLANEVEISKAKEGALSQSLEELRSQTRASLQVEVELAELERQAQVARTLYENFLSRFRETREQEDLQRPDARIISYAEPPGGPSHPDKQRALGVGAMAGLMLGLMCAFLLESMDRGFRQSEQLEQMTGLPVLGMLPLVRKSKRNPVDYVADNPLSRMGEALRGIRVAIQLSNVDHPPKTIMVASSLPGEGKTTFCISFGRITAMSGARVLLIDGDLRRPRIARMLGLSPEAWLEDVLTGEKDVQSGVLTDPKTGLHVICGKGGTPNAADLLGSERMKKLIQTATKKYDMVIIDAPPLMGVADAWSLAQSIDELVFIVRWAETPRETVRAAMRQIAILNLPAKGVILSQVDIRKQTHYGYGSYGYYSGRHGYYYKE